MGYRFNTISMVKAVLLLTCYCFNIQILSKEINCSEYGDYGYLCGMTSPEDLVQIPETNWVILSGFSGQSALYLANANTKTWRNLYPASSPVAKQNMAIYSNCPGSPDPNNFTGHGLNIRRLSHDHYMLYVVGHGEREAIEVFEIDTSPDEPVITWIGCVLTPDEIPANSVASLKDGSLLATLPMPKNGNIDNLFANETNGAVYRWSPGDETFSKIQGTEMRYANGIEISDDESEFYIAASGDINIMAFSNTNPARLLRTSKPLKIIPDNLRWHSNGHLITAGMHIDDPDCGRVPLNKEFKFTPLASCPRAFMALTINPANMQVSILENSPSHEYFSNITMAIEVNNEIWFGTFAGDRAAYKKVSNQ